MHRIRPQESKIMKGYSLALGLVLVVSTAACASDSHSEDKRASSINAIHAAVIQQLVESDNTFGPDHRFSEVLIVDHEAAEAEDYMSQGRPGDPLTEEQRSAISAAVEHLSPVRFIGNPSDFIRQDVLQPVIPGSAIITLAPVEFDRQGATVGVSLWCGGVCGLWLTYRVAEGPDGWTVVGTEGNIAIS